MSLKAVTAIVLFMLLSTAASRTGVQVEAMSLESKSRDSPTKSIFDRQPNKPEPTEKVAEVSQIVAEVR